MEKKIKQEHNIGEYVKDITECEETLDHGENADIALEEEKVKCRLARSQI